MPDTIINFTTHALGDNIGFSPYGDVYQKKYGGKVYVRTKWHNILKSNNPDVQFVDLGFEIPNATVKNVDFLFQRGPLQKIICDQLDLEYNEIRPTINTKSKYSFNKKKKYICIGVQSTAQLKYWNLNDGWEKLTKYIKDKGYDVYCIDRDEVFGTKEKWNRMPHNARNETGNHPIEYRIQQIKNCQFYIGVSSGLSWLAWALGKKVVLISGCTGEDNEFSEDCYRVINKTVCHGCLNDPTINNVNGIKTGWMYCPRNKNFECTKKISLEDVKIAVNKCIYDIDNDLKNNIMA